MKKRVLSFVFLALFILSIIPAVNLKIGNAQKQVGKKWWSSSVLFNIDFALPFLSRILYPFGISIDPHQVIIGKNGWLYLGDMQQNTITLKRRGATAEDRKTAQRIGLAIKSWERWLRHKGVRLYRVMLAPDKETIYQEFLPGWAMAIPDSATNALLDNVGQELYMDLRAALRAAKSQFSEPLYYRTDSHWNALGAWVAFRAFTLRVDDTENGLQWLSEQQIRLKVGPFRWGDLSNLLRMPGRIEESTVRIEIVSDHPIESELYDFETGHLNASGDITHKIGYPERPVVVKSKHALNRKRVLWLLDSFGLEMIRFMTATFTETLIFPYGSTNPNRFAQMVDRFKPDYVFMTVVERIALDKYFENLPPTMAVSAPADR